MATIADRRGVNPQPKVPITVPIALYANIVWILLLGAGSLYVGLSILTLEGTFFDLGRTVQTLVGLIALIPAGLAAYSIQGLLRWRPNGRFVAIILNYGSGVLAGIVLLHLWGVFNGFDLFARALLHNAQWTLGFALAYAIYWLAGRLDDGFPMRDRLIQAALGIGGVTLIILLWNMGAPDVAIATLGTYRDPAVWLATAALAISVFLAWNMLKMGKRFGETTPQQEAWQGWMLLSPNIIGFLLFFAGPLLLSFYISFTNDTVGPTPPDWVGTTNYTDILSLQFRTLNDPAVRAQETLDIGFSVLLEMNLGSSRFVVGAKDPLFWYSLRNTLLYCLMLIPLSVLPALALAMILNSKLPGMKFFRAVYFLPSVAAVVGTALIWRWLYDPVIGIINYGLQLVVNVINGIFNGGIAPVKIEWLTDSSTQLLALVLLGAWQVIGFNTVLFLAGLQGIPKLLYEAAYSDGANTWERFRHVTLPLLAPTTFFVTITTMITGLQVFNEPYALIFVRPMPLNTTTVVYYLYNRGFFRFEFGYASAVAWLLFGLIFLATLAQFRLQRSRGYE